MGGKVVSREEIEVSAERMRKIMQLMTAMVMKKATRRGLILRGKPTIRDPQRYMAESDPLEEDRVDDVLNPETKFSFASKTHFFQGKSSNLPATVPQCMMKKLPANRKEQGRGQEGD